jgi:ABC-type transporter Mla subunit MlaD
MADDEIKKNVGFIIEQQAQFSANLGRLEEVVARLADITLRKFEDTDKRFSEVDEKIAALVDSQMRTEESLRVVTENLKNLTAVADKYFRNLNGKSEG